MTTSPTYGMPVVVVDAHLLPDISNEVTLHKLLLLFVRTFDPLVDISYIIVYLNNPATAPELNALKSAYEKLDRRYKKNLNKFYVVPSTAFIDTAMSFVSPFISGKTKATESLRNPNARGALTPCRPGPPPGQDRDPRHARRALP